jgi:hypothetical protein
MRKLTRLILLLGFTLSARASNVVDKTYVEGKVFLQSVGMVPYRLSIDYSPEPSAPNDFRRISNISLTLAGKEIIIPKKSYSDLRAASRSWPLYGVGGEPKQFQFWIEGGDGAKSYKVKFFISTERLIYREMLRHDSEKPEVIRFDKRTAESEKVGECDDEKLSC